MDPVVRDLVTIVGPLVTLLLVILWAGAKERWVYGSIYQDVKDQRDMWMHLALEQQGVTDTSLNVAQEAIRAPRPRAPRKVK